MDQRISFVVRVLGGNINFSMLCKEFGISRPTGYKWLQRYDEVRSFARLEEKSRRPLSSPARTSPDKEERVVELRQRYGWGGKKLQHILAKEGILLSVPTVNRIIKRSGLIEEKKRQYSADTRFERSAPNELWQMDFKGEYKIRSGGYCYPLTLLDDHSRYSLGVYSLLRTRVEEVERCLIRAFEEYGVPDAMLMDHGAPWWSSTNGWGLTRLSVWLIKHGVELIYSGIGHPQTQGKIERFHRTLKDALRHRGEPNTIDDFTLLFKEIREEYNNVRPHEALGMGVPAERYERSQKNYSPSPKD